METLQSILTEAGPAGGSILTVVGLAALKAAGWLLLPRREREVPTLPSRLWVGLCAAGRGLCAAGRGLYAAGWLASCVSLLWLAPVRWMRGRTAWGEAPAPPPPPEPEPVSEALAAMLDEIATSPKACVEKLNGKRCLRAGALAVGVESGVAGNIWIDGAEVTNDFTSGERASLCVAAASRVNAIEAEQLAARRAHVAAKVRGDRTAQRGPCGCLIGGPCPHGDAGLYPPARGRK